MEVTNVYMDLVEGVRKGNVWKLESEAFKDPIEIKICYDNHDLARFTTTCEALDKKIREQEGKIWELGSENRIAYWNHKELKNQVELQEKVIQEQENKIRENKSDLNELYKEVASLKTMVETLSGTILHLQEQVKLLEKKVTKQPIVIHDKWFISWHEPAWLWMVELGDGDYLLIMNTKIWEHNEYVDNKDELIMEKIHVEWQHYVPFYKLEWGTALDKPTATIYYDLIFIPI